MTFIAFTNKRWFLAQEEKYDQGKGARQPLFHQLRVLDLPILPSYVTVIVTNKQINKNNKYNYKENCMSNVLLIKYTLILLYLK